ncbi:MAG: type III-B CRISPR module RAMP protein Cmr4 [Thermoanaerobacterium thermosaccharolyticum]|jgi:CRISPR-associated protein Cmr4
MFLKFKPFFLIAETPLHPGSGDEIGIVDLPIQRERYTNFPKIEASSIKGCMREAFKNSLRLKNEIDDEKRKKYVKLIFGPENGNEHAGALAFMDAKILFFPVKSLKGIFAWITCPQVLERFRKDMGIAKADLKDFPTSIKEYTLPEEPNIIISKDISRTASSKIVLEEFTFDVTKQQDTGKLAKWFAQRIFPSQEPDDPYKYWREKLEKDLVILPDDEFAEFVSTSTEIIARTVINDGTGTAENLWFEEYLPQDTILYSIAMATAVRIMDESEKRLFSASTSEEEAEKVIDCFEKGILSTKVIQIGGNQTIGKGFTRIQFLEEGTTECPNKP